MRFCPLDVEEVAVVMLSETADTVVGLPLSGHIDCDIELSDG